MNTTSTPPANATWKKITAVCLSAALLLFVSLQTIAQVIPAVHCNSTAATATFTQSTPTAISTGAAAVVTSTLVVSGASTYLFDLNLTTFITHTWCNDLDITLTSPSGTVVTLTTDNAGSNENVFNGTIWDDDANPAGAVPYLNNNGLVTDHLYADLTLASPLVPEEALGAFIGENPNGTWTITISDDAAGDGGSLASWSMQVTGLATAPSTFFDVFSNSPALALVDNGVVSSTITVTGIAPYILDLNVMTNITHTWSSDLDVTITSPVGTVVTLTTDNAAGNNDVFAGTTWNDDADPDGLVPYTSNNGLVSDQAYVNLTIATPLVPEDALSAFIGEDPNGVWTITISDDEAIDVGILNSWGLDFETVGDVIPPVITCGANITVNNATGICASAAITLTGTASASDACSTPTITYLPASGSTFPVGTTTVTATATDAAGNTSTCTFDVIVSDTENPTLTCPLDIVQPNDAGLCSAVVNYTTPVGVDNCEPVVTQSLSQSIVSFNSVSCNDGFGHTNNSYLRVFDLASLGYTNDFYINSVDVGIEEASGFGGSQPATVNIYSLTGPLVFANLTLLATEAVTVADQTASILNIPLTSQLTVPAGTTLVVEFFTPNGQVDGNLIFIGSNPVGQTGDTYLAAADCGITEPTDVALIGFPGMHWVLNINAGTLTEQTAGSASGSTFAVGGPYTQTFQATDVYGNTSTCSFDVTVEDTEAPTFLGCLQNITVSNEAGICSADVTYPSFGGTQTGTGNITQTGDILENGLVSNTLFPLTCADDIFIPGSLCYDFNTLSVPFWSNNVSDASAMIINFYSDAGGVPGAIVSTQTLTSADWTTSVVGNSFGLDINQFDFTFPSTVSLCGSGAGTTYWMSVQAVNSLNGGDFYWGFNASAPYGDNGAWDYFGGWSTIDPGSFGSYANFLFDLGYSYSFTTGVTDNCPGVVIDYSIASGSTFPVGTTPVTITATDVAGNSSNCVFNVTVEDNEAPSITCVGNIAVDNELGLCSANVSYDAPTVDDNCSLVYVPVLGASTPFTGPSITITDNTTNSDIQSVSGVGVNLGTDVALQSVCLNVTHTWVGDLEFVLESPNGDQITLMSSPACGGDDLDVCFIAGTGNPLTGGTCLDLPAYSGNFTAESGNLAAFASGTDPNGTWTLYATDGFTFDEGVVNSWTLNFAPITGFTAATPVQTAGLASGSDFPVGTTTNTFEITDAAGNTSTCSFDVVVSDVEAPVLSCPDVTVNNDAGLCSAVVNYTEPVGVDNCDPVVLTQSLDQAILFGNSVSCNDGFGHTDNSYMRVFDLPALGYTNDFYINSVDVGIEQAAGLGGSQSATLNLYSLSGPLLFANLTLLASEPVTVADQFATILNISLTNQLTVPAGTTLVVEFLTPNGQVDGNLIFIGSNNLGQTGDTYLSAADCGITEPTSVADIGFPDMHWVLNVNAGSLTEFISGIGTGGTFPVGSTTETYQSTDVHGNVSTCSFDVIVNDIEVPTISCGTNPPSPLTITQVSNGFEDGRISNALWINGNGISADDLSVAANTCFDVNSISANFFSNSPGSTSAMNVIFYSDGSGEPGSVINSQVLSPGDWTTTLVGNNFGIDVYRFDLTLPLTVTLCAGPSATTYWFSVQGENSIDNFYWENSTLNQYGSNGQFNLDGTGWVNNGDNFVFDLNGSTYGGLTTYTSTNDPGVCGAAITIAAPTSADNCPLTLTNSFNGTSDASDVYPVGTTTVTWTVTDPSGNSASCDVLVVVTDDEFPVFSNCPSDIFADNDPGQCGAVVSFDPLEFSDNCTLPGVPVLGTAVPFVGSSVAISDNTTNTGSQSVSGVGTTLGTDVVLQSICLNVTHTWVGDLEFVLESPTGDQITLMSGPGCSGDDLDVCFVVGTGNPLIGGSCGDSPAYSGDFTAESGDLADLGVGSDPNGTWTLYATDMAGGDVGFVNSWTLNFAPIVGFDPAAAIQTAGLPSGSEYPVGTTTNTFEITDASGNTTACSFDVVVSDIEAPTITCASDIEVDNDLGVCGATVTYDAPTGFQQILEQLGNSFENGFVSNSSFPNIGADNFVIADGDCNDISNVTANFFVTNPTSVSDFDIIFYDDNNGEPGNILNTVNVTPSDWTTSYQGSNFGFDIYEYNFNLPSAVTLCGSTGGTEYWMSVVANGTAGFDYFWEVSTAGDYGSEGVLAPSTSGPWDDSEGIDFVFSLNDGGNTPDNCTGPVTVTQTDGTGFTTGDVFPIGTTLQEYTAEDQYGNISFCSFDVTVIDAEAPAIVCPSDIIACENDTETVFDLPTATDNCNVDSIVQIAGLPSGSDFPAGITINTFVAYDPALNTDTCSFTVTITPSPIADFSYFPTCIGEIIYFTSDATVDTVLGSSIVSYEWEFNDGSGVNTDVNPTHVYNTAGDYDVTLTVTTNWGCEFTITHTVTVDSTPEFTTTVADALCYGESNGSITVDVTVGTTPVEYSINGGPLQSSNVFSGLAAGNYLISVTTASGCTASAAVTVGEPEELVAGIESTTDALCFGQSSGAVEVSAIGGTEPYSYSIDGGASQPSGVFAGLEAGSYVVTVTDDNGCTSSITVTVGEPDEIVVDASSEPVLCNGDASGSIEVTATGGTGVLQYSADGGNTFQPTGTFSGLAAGTYVVVVEDENGCSVSEGVVITEPSEALAATAEVQNVACTGDASGSVVVSASGGTGAYTYSSDGGTTTQSSNVFGELAAGDYTITVTDANGCSTTVDVTVEEPAELLTIETTATPVSCNGQGDGMIDVTATGGGAPYEYSFNGGITYQSSGSFTNLAPGTYTVIVRDGNGCEVASIVVITQPSALTVNAVSSSPSSCEGDDDGSFTVAAAGGAEPYTYTSNGNSNSTGVFTNVTSGTHLVTVNDASGCSASIVVEVGYTSPLPVAAFNWFASGSVVQFSNQSDNGTSYDWNFGDGGTSTLQNPVHTYAAGGTYTVTLIVTNACGSDTVIWVIDTNNIGINDPNADASVLNVYPNPNHGVFTLSYTSTGVIGDIQVNVMTIEGKLLMAEQFTVNADTFVRNYSDIELAAGIYIVQFISQTGTEVKRITVDK